MSGRNQLTVRDRERLGARPRDRRSTRATSVVVGPGDVGQPDRLGGVGRLPEHLERGGRGRLATCAIGLGSSTPAQRGHPALRATGSARSTGRRRTATSCSASSWRRSRRAGRRVPRVADSRWRTPANGEQTLRRPSEHACRGRARRRCRTARSARRSRRPRRTARAARPGTRRSRRGRCGTRSVGPEQGAREPGAMPSKTWSAKPPMPRTTPPCWILPSGPISWAPTTPISGLRRPSRPARAASRGSSDSVSSLRKTSTSPRAAAAAALLTAE